MMARSSSADLVQTYVATVQRARANNDESVWRRVAELVSDEVSWRFAGGGGDQPWPVEIRGRDALVAALSRSTNAWSRMRTETTSVHACGSIVLVEQITTLIDDQGREAVKPVAHVFTIVDDMIAAIRTYRNDLRTT